MKRTWPFLIALLLLAVRTAQAQFMYTVNPGGSGITITGYTGSGGVVTIPSEINSRSVTSLGTNSFAFNSSLTSVTIPNSVTSIGSEAFLNCNNLSNVTIGTNVTNIGDYAFDGTSLTSINIPGSVANIGVGLLSFCTSLTAINVNTNNPAYVSLAGVLFNKRATSLIEYPAGKVGTFYTIPDSVTSIEDDAFDECTNLTSLTIPESVTNIGDGAFGLCISLSSLTIPNSVTSLGQERSIKTSS